MNNSKKPSEFSCKFCFIIKFKIDGKSLIMHELKCFFNSFNFNFLTLKKFKTNILPIEGICPKCFKHFNSLKTRANSCFRSISGFSSYISLGNNCNQNFINSSYDTELLSELPFFSFEGILTERKLIKIEVFKNHIERITEFKNKHFKKFFYFHLNIN